MDVLRPIRTVLFIYEIFRFLLLLLSLFIAPLEGGSAMVFFPYLVYLTANALFPLMVLFVWLKPEEYRNYLSLYMAGKIIGIVSFYVWEFFSFRFREFPEAGNLAKSVVLLGVSVFISLADVLSVWGAWTLKNKGQQAEGGGV